MLIGVVSELISKKDLSSSPEPAIVLVSIQNCLTRFLTHLLSTRLVFAANKIFHIWREIRDYKTTSFETEVTILAADQKNRGLRGQECQTLTFNNQVFPRNYQEKFQTSACEKTYPQTNRRRISPEQSPRLLPQAAAHLH